MNLKTQCKSIFNHNLHEALFLIIFSLMHKIIYLLCIYQQLINFNHVHRIYQGHISSVDISTISYAGNNSKHENMYNLLF